MRLSSTVPFSPSPHPNSVVVLCAIMRQGLGRPSWWAGWGKCKASLFQPADPTQKRQYVDVTLSHKPNCGPEQMYKQRWPVNCLESTIFGGVHCTLFGVQRKKSYSPTSGKIRGNPHTNFLFGAFNVQGDYLGSHTARWSSECCGLLHVVSWGCSCGLKMGGCTLDTQIYTYSWHSSPVDRQPKDLGSVHSCGCWFAGWHCAAFCLSSVASFSPSVKWEHPL